MIIRITFIRTEFRHSGLCPTLGTHCRTASYGAENPAPGNPEGDSKLSGTLFPVEPVAAGYRRPIGVMQQKFQFSTSIDELRKLIGYGHAGHSGLIIALSIPQPLPAATGCSNALLLP
jgi:hypothetical protein